MCGALGGFLTTSYFFKKDIALEFTQDNYLPLISSIADFNRSYERTKRKDRNFPNNLKVYSSKEIKEHDTKKVQQALKKFVESGGLRILRDLEIEKYEGQDSAFLLMDEAYRLGILSEKIKDDKIIDLQRKKINSLYGVLFTERGGKNKSFVIPDPNFLRIGPKDFSDWYMKFLNMETSPQHHTKNEDFEKFSFKRYKLQGVSHISGLVAIENDTFYVVGDQDQNSFQKISFIKEDFVAVQNPIKLNFSNEIRSKVLKNNPDFNFSNLDLEGITYNSQKKLFYIISEENRAILTVNTAGNVLDHFSVNGKDPEPNRGLEGITYDMVNKIIAVVNEGPIDGHKTLYRFKTDGTFIGDTQINTKERITGIFFSPKENAYFALNTFRNRKPKMHFIIKFSVQEGATHQHFDFHNHYENFSEDYENYLTNYEGIDMDRHGNIFIVNDSMGKDETQLLKISLKQKK